MPFYNCEKFLDESISSILWQTFSDFEFIIINDASTDSSDTVVTKYLADPRIIYIKNQERRGIVYNLNNAFSYVHTDIIARMDGDDISHLQRLEKQYIFLQENPEIDIVGSYIDVIDDKWNKIRSTISKPTCVVDVKKYLLKFLTIFHGSSMIRRKIYDSIGYYREEWLYCEDYDWTFRAIYGGFSGTNLSESLYYYRYHGASTNTHSHEIALRVYKLKKVMKREFQIHYTVSNYIFLYIQFCINYFLPGRKVQWIESIYKKYFF